jgi:hypothetical protein
VADALTTFGRPALALGALGALAGGCADVTTPPLPEPEPAAEYVTVRRAWLPGERDSLIARIQRTRQFNAFYMDLSDYAVDLLPVDSAIEIVPVPMPVPDVATPFGPVRAVPRAIRVPGTGWSVIGIDTKLINTDPTPDDTLRWLGWLWFDTADSTQKGFAFAFRAPTSNTVAATFVNTPAFDAAFGKAGAGAGEVDGIPPAPLTYWQGNGWVRRNTVSMSLNFSFSGTTPVTTGPYTGGTSQVAFMSGVLDSIRLDRVSGSASPATQYASIRLTFVGGIRLVCVFPSPCTTNALMSPPLRAWLARGREGGATDR